jgi:hypothetical protein
MFGVPSLSSAAFAVMLFMALAKQTVSGSIILDGSTPSPTESAYPSADPTYEPTEGPSESAFPSSPPSPSPTLAPIAPTPMPTDVRCKGIEDYKWEEKKGRGCKWVKQNFPKRCKLFDDVLSINVKEACPMECDRRCSCTNLRTSFKFGDKKKNYNCRKVKPSKGDCLEKAGRKKTVADFCPRKCGDCFQNNIRTGAVGLILGV